MIFPGRSARNTSTTPPELTVRDLSSVPTTTTPSQLPTPPQTPEGYAEHLERLQRNQQRESFSERARRMSRFSTVSSTPTAVDPHEGPPPFATAVPPPPPKRPTIKEVARKHPRNIVYISILTAIFAGGVAGWAIYHNMRGSQQRSGLVVNGLFVVILIIVFLLACRQAIFMYRLFRPIAPNQTPTLPPWLVGRPPTYREALRTSGAARGTGDVEDGFIAQNENLPKYGEYTGSTLLARSQSRGGNLPQADGGDVGLVNMAERPRGGVEQEQAEEVLVAREGEDPEARETRLREERESELRQIAEARMLQAGGAGAGEGAVAGVAPATQQREEVEEKREKWEEVSLERRDGA